MQFIFDVNGKVLFEGPEELTEHNIIKLAIKEKASLCGANLQNWYLAGISLVGANLEGADLRGAILRSCDLRNVDFEEADLNGAVLTYSMLGNSYFNKANLRGAQLPSPTMVLLAYWGELSDQLTADLMLWDSLNHPDPSSFDKWANGGDCPYMVQKEVSRAANFKEKAYLWGKGKECTPYSLMKRVLAEKCPDWKD